MASDVDQDNGDHQCLLKLYIRTSENPSEDWSDSYGIVRALYETLTEKSADFTTYITGKLAKEGITLNNSQITCEENLFIQFHWYCDRGLDRRKLNLHLSSGLLHRILKPYIDGLDIQGKIVGPHEQKLALDIRIQCDSPERPVSVSETSQSTEKDVIRTTETAKFPTERVTHEKEIPTGKSTKESFGDSESSCEHLEPEFVKSDVTENKTNTDGKFDYHTDSFELFESEHVKSEEGKFKYHSGTDKLNPQNQETSLEPETVKDSEQSRKKCVTLHLDLKDKYYIQQLVISYGNSGYQLKNVESTNVWKIDISIPKQLHENFMFSIMVTYYVPKSYVKAAHVKTIRSLFLDQSGSRYVFIGMTNDIKTYGTDGLCEFVVDIINNVAPVSLRDALSQIEAMANQQNVEVRNKDNNKKCDHGIVFDKDETLKKCNFKSLIESVKGRTNQFSRNLMAFCYFLFVVLSGEKSLPEKSLTILDMPTAKSIIDSCRYIKKEEIPPPHIEPIVSIVKLICTIVHGRSSSALLVIDKVYGFASTDVLMKIIDECQYPKGRLPLYVRTDSFQWKNLLLKMNEENSNILSKVVKQLNREMLIELLEFFCLEKNNDAVKQFEHVLNSRNCDAVIRFGHSKELHHILSTWGSTAIFNFQPSKKFINETEKAILSCISKEFVVSKNEFKLILKVLSDDNLFLGEILQINLIENLSSLKTAYSANSSELLIAILNHENLTASGTEINDLILHWFSRGLELKQVQKCEKGGSKIISRSYLRLRDIMQTKYVREQDKVMCLLEDSVFEFIKQFKFKSVAKVLHEADDSDVQDILVAHITKLLQKGCFGHDVNAIMQDFCENDVLNATKSKVAEVVIAIVETMGIPQDTSPETVLGKVLEGSQFWKKVLNVTGEKKGKIEEHKLVILVKNAIQKTFVKLKDKSISCKFVQYLEKNKTKVQEISSHMSKTDILVDELIICHEKLSHFQDDLIIIEKLLDFVVKNHVGILIPYSAHLYDYVYQQRIKIDDGTLALLYLFQPSTYLKKIRNIADICRRIELISTSCVFWNIVRQHLEKQPNMVNHIFLQFLCFGLNRNQDLDQEELNTSIISSTEIIFCSIAKKCMPQFKHIWRDYRHDMKQNISETVQVFQRIENMESEIKTAEIICNFELPDENRNSLVRFSRFKEYRKTVEQIKAVAKSFKFQETPNSKFKQTVTKFEKMMDGNFSNLTLKEITPVLDQIHNIMTIIKVNEDLSDILSAINDSSELLDFLREVIDEDIRNLIDAVEEHSEQYVRESTVSNLIEVKRFFHPMLNDDLNVNIGGLFKLLNKQHKDSGIHHISEKIQVCRDHLHSLMALYRNVANRGEHTVELIDKIMLKGTFHFKLEKRMCEVFVHYEHEKKDFKYKYMDLNDLRSRALLIMNAEKKFESDHKDLIKEQLNKFVTLVDNAFEIQAICLNLKQAGHFAFAFYETKCGKDEMFELKIRLQKQYDDWTTKIEAIRSKYYYMNFLFSDQLYELYTFLKGNTETSTKNDTCAMAILKFMGLSTDDSESISLIYQRYPPPDPDDYTTALDNIGLTLNHISEKTPTNANIRNEIGDERKAPFIEKVQAGKPYFAWLDESSSLVIKVLLALYYNTTNLLPEANQVLFCNENTTFEEIDLLIRRCNESMQKPKTKDLFSIVNVELLKREVQITLIDRIRHLSNGDFLLCFICRGNDTHPFLDQFKHSLFKLSPISEAKMDQCFKTHCKHVLVVTSDVPGAGKTELIQNKAINDKKRCKTIHVSGPLNRLSIIEGLLQLELKHYHSLHIDIGTVSDPFELDLFLFQLIVLKYVSAGSTSYALSCANKIYIEIANSVENTLCDALSTVTVFQREHLKWKNYEDLKVSMEINSPIQVVCRYLKELDECLVDENDLYFNGPNAVQPLTESTCKEILLKKFNDSSDMSYTLVNVFVRVLADQLKKLSSSLYFQTSSVKAILGKDQPMTVRSQVVKLLVEIARMFADRSVHTCRATQVAFLLSDGDKKLNVEEILAKRVSGMIRWDESNHLMILFHKDIQTISAIYRHLHEVPKSIIQLVESQSRKKLTNFDLKETTELENLLIQLAREPDRYISSELLDALRKTYVLTPDNLLKMIIISLRINTRIPVIIMGETGCGKTSLIQYLATMCGIELEIFSIHAGTSEENIYSRISLASQKAFSNLNDVFLLFLDEINTCEHLGLITSALCHGFCRDFQLAPNLTLLAACNPYRLRREDSIHTKGLQGKIKTDHLSKLVYRVQPLPETMMDFVWDYGSLSQTDEQAYILKMVEMVHFTNGMSEMLKNVLVMSQKFVRRKEGNDYCVSLRDIDRCTKLIKWLFDSFLGKKSKTLDIQTKRLHSIILSLAICYQSRFCDGSIREDYRKKIAAEMNMTESEIEDIITDEQENILNKMEYLPEGTALNVALKENVFMLLICILSKIPISLVGNPGCSKSLSIQLIRSNLRGKDSANDLFKDMPQLFCVSFQGSESSTSEGIIKVFEKAQKYQEYNDEKDVLSLVILDEIGLAEESRFNPLKVLHEILEPGQGKQLNIAFVGISNWALDAAKMNRAIHLSRPDMSLKDLQLTGQSICKSMMAATEKDTEFVLSVKTGKLNDSDYSNNIVQRLLDGIASGYQEYCSKTQKFPHFHGLRDFYSLTKYIGRKMEDILSAGEKKLAEEILIGILRNFGGLPTEKENILEIFRKYIPCITSTPVPVIRLIRENIQDKTSRHLMLIASGNAVVSVLERELNEMKLDFDIIFGSNFKEDLNDDYNYRILSRIILCMEKGMVLILKDLDAIYGSLYDMLNQNYTVVGKKKNCRVALGHYSNPMCHVHDDFKCIVLVEEYNLDYSDPPFLNRFEKQHFQFTDLLKTEKMKEMVEEISQEMTSLCQIPNHSFIPEDVIPSYSLDLIVSLIVHLNQKVDDKHIKDCAFERMLWLIPPEVMIRAKESKFSQSKQYFVTEKIRNFMKLPIHGGICHFSQNFKHSALESTRIDGSSDQFVECFVVYTYSSLHSVIEDWFGDDEVQKQKIASFKSEKEFTTTVEHFFESKRSVFILQCTAGSETQHMLLSKTIIEKVVRKYQQTRELNQSRKYVYVIFHLDRGCYVHLPVNFLSSWNLLYMDSIQKPRTPLDHFIKVDKLEIVRERMPLHNYITDALFWVLSRIKFASDDDLTGSLLEFLLSSLNSCQFAIDTIEEMIVSWIERRMQSESSSTWCINVAKSPHDLILSGNLIEALENTIQDFIKTPLSKYIFKMIDLNILTPVIFEDEFTTFRRESWRKCVLSTEHLNIKDIPEPSGPECYSCSSRFLNLRMPFSQVFSQTIENRKDEFLYIFRRRCIEGNIEVDEEISRESFENVVNDSIEIICYDALTIDHYPSQNDDYIYDFSNLFSSQFLSTDEPNRIQIFKWALSNFIDLPLYSSRKFENLVAALHATVWVYGTVVKAICLMALEPAASLDLTYYIPLPDDTIVTGFQNKGNTENDSHSIRIADLDRQSFVTVICLSLLPTSTVLKYYEISKWLLKVGQILQLAQSVHYESSALRYLKLCHEISEALFENKIPVENYIYQIADSLKNPKVTIDSEEVCNIIFETLKKMHETNVDGKVLQNLFCSYIVRCMNTNSKNVYPFNFSLEKIASNEVFDETLNYYGQILKYAVALDANENPNVFFEMLSGEKVLDENMQFCKCLDVCLKKLDYKLDKNMYLPVLATDILEYVAFGEDLSIDEMNKVNSASSKLFTYLTQALNLADKGICSIYTLVSVAYIRKFLKNAFAILKTCKYDCTDKGVLASQVNAILCQRKDTGFVTLLSSEMLHLFLKIVEHVSGQENVEKILRKLDNTIIVLQNIHWNTEVVEEMPVFNPLILHVETNALGEYQRHIKEILTDGTPLSELLNDTSSGSPITILCLLTKQFYMKKCFHQLTDDEKRTANAIVEIVDNSFLNRKVKDIIEHVLGQKDFKHGIFNLSEATESPVPQIVSVMIHLATIIVMNNQDNTAWHKQLFCPLSVKFELSADLPPIIRDVLKLIWYSCLTCSYAFEFADTKSLEELTSKSSENLEEYLRESLENSWTCLHDLLEINYFDICLLLHEFLFKSKDLFAGKAEEYMNNFSEQLIHEHAVILEGIMGNRMQVIHEAKTRFARKIGSDLEQCVLDDRHCRSNVEFPKVALLLRLSRSSSKNMLLTEIHAGHKSRFRFLTTVVKNMPKLVLPKHLSSLIKWHYSVVTFGTYKFRKLDFKDMTVSSFLCAFNEDSQRNVLEKAFNKFAKSWNEIRSALSNLKEVLNGQTESGKLELSLMHKNATMKECSIIDEDSIFVEVLKYLANIQNQFLKDSGDKVTNVDSMRIHTISIQDVKCEHLISFKMDDDWIDYCQCETRYGLGQKINFYLDMIEKDMEEDILSGKVFVEIPNPVMKIIFIDELFQNSIELLKEISRKHVQNLLPEKIKTAIRLQTSRDISTVSQLLTHTGMTLSLLRKKGSGPIDMSIREYLHNLIHITGMSSSVINSLFSDDIKMSHAVNLYQWLEELNGDSIIDTLEDEYRIELQDNAIQSLHMAKQYMNHLEKLDHPLKVFAHRCLSVTSNKIRHSQSLNEYLANKDLWWQDDLKNNEDKKNGGIFVVADGVCRSLEELLSPLIMIKNIYYTVKFLAEAIKEAKQKEQPFFNMEQPKVEKQNPKKEHGKQVIRKMKKRL